MASIITRTINGEVDQRLVLSGEQCGRTMSIGNNWTSMRLGVRFSINRTSAYTAPPTLFAGICSGTSEMYADGTTKHFIGVRSNASNWGYATGYLSPANNSFVMFKKVGTTRTDSSLQTLSNAAWIGSSPTYRGSIIIDFTKNNGTFVEVKFYISMLNQWDNTDAIFTNIMQSFVAPSSTHTTMASSNITVDEATNGYFDTINVGWLGITEGMEISDIAYSRLV